MSPLLTTECEDRAILKQNSQLLKNITNSHIGQKNLILMNVQKQMYSFNLYDWYANLRDFSKAWQMKLKLWHLILQKIVKVSSGQKNQTFCQIYMKKFFLSLPITFSVLVNVIPYQIFIQKTQITVFIFFQQNLEHYQYYKNAPIVRRLFVPHPWHLLSSPLYDVSDHTNHIFSVRIWSWQHVSVNISSVAELSPVYCCLVLTVFCVTILTILTRFNNF